MCLDVPMCKMKVIIVPIPWGCYKDWVYLIFVKPFPQKTVQEQIQGFSSRPTFEDGRGCLAQLLTLQVGKQAYKGQGCKEQGAGLGQNPAPRPGPESAHSEPRIASFIFSQTMAAAFLFLFWRQQ